MSKIETSTIQSRASVIELVPQDEGEPVISAALSSEEPADRPYGREVLTHTKAAINMVRAVNTLPITVNHSERDPMSPHLPIGRAHNVHLGKDRRLRGDLHFDNDAEGEAVRGKVLRGVAPDISLTYRTSDDYDGPTKDGTVTFNRWTPLAVSIVTMPEDATVGVGRSIDVQEPKVSTETTQAPAAGANDTDTTIDDPIAAVKSRTAAGFKAGVEAEQIRHRSIDALARQLSDSMPAIADQLGELAIVAKGKPDVNEDKFRSLAFDLIAGNPQPLSDEGPSLDERFARRGASVISPNLPGVQRQPVITAGTQQHNSVASRGMELSLIERAGGKFEPKEMEGNQYRGWSMKDLAEQCLRSHGIDTRGMNPEQIAKNAIAFRAISPGTANYDSTDFASVTSGVATKLVYEGYAEADRTWDQFCSTNTAPDFKQFQIPQLSAFSSLPTVAPNVAYTDGTLTDSHEVGTLEKRGSLLSLTWEAMVNDDMSMFSRNAGRMGESSMRTIDEQVYAVLTDNAAMVDTVALFHATHGNTSALPFDKAGIIAARTAMGRQVDSNSVALGIRLAYVLVPLEMQDPATELATADNLPITFTSGTEGIAATRERNTLRGTFTPISTARLTDVNDWYASARIGQGLEVVFLASQGQQPSVERESGWDTDAIHWKVRIVFRALPPDWRGLYWASNT